MQISVAILIANANSGISYVKKLIKSFKARVIADLGIFEAEACLYAALTNLNNIELLRKASLVVTPNAYKASKLYSVVPNTTLGDMDVVRATTATRVNASGLIESVANNVPRLDYLNASCPSILVEPQRTNVQISSEDFSNAIYLQIGVTVTTNAIVAPDGNTTADRLTEDTSTGFHTIDILNPPVVAGSYTVSVFVKAAERTKFQILGFFALTGNVDFDLTLGTATTTAPALNGKIENYGNGWYRCQATFTDLTGVGAQILFNILNNAGSNSYTGDGTSGLILWGAQLELGTYSTSYIPTVASTVTRNADVISKTGISSLIGQTEGTVFVDFKLNGNSYSDNTLLYYITLAKNSPFNFFEILRYNNSLLYYIAVNGVGVGPRVLTAFSNLNGNYKFAVSYNSSGLKCFLNGTQIYTSSDVIPTCDEINFGDYDATVNQKNNFNSVQLYKTALSDTEIATLTTI